MNIAGKIYFSQNWNGKLDCNFFTTLRLQNDNKYIVGESYEIVVKKVPFCVAKIVEVRYILLDDINDWVARLDTGYNADNCKVLLRTMYKHKNIDWRTQKLAYLMLEKHNPYL